ncbi:hypothetical protein [Weissella soli]|uniref:hypothetical protein n=1 Tax=Weissella soli TaxID=155866 RepID=UPI0035A0E9AC
MKEMIDLKNSLVKNVMDNLLKGIITTTTALSIFTAVGLTPVNAASITSATPTETTSNKKNNKAAFSTVTMAGEYSETNTSYYYRIYGAFNPGELISLHLHRRTYYGVVAQSAQSGIILKIAINDAPDTAVFTVNQQHVIGSKV